MMGFFLGALLFSGSTSSMYSIQGQQFIELYDSASCEKVGKSLVNTGYIVKIEPISRWGSKKESYTRFETANKRGYYLCVPYKTFIEELKSATEKLKNAQKKDKK